MTGDTGHLLPVVDTRFSSDSPMSRTSNQPHLISPINPPTNGVTCSHGHDPRPTGTPVAARAARGSIVSPVEDPLPVMPIASPPPFPLLA